MALTDTAVKNAKPNSDKPAGYKMTDGGGMYLLVKTAGKYWRMDYSYVEKRKTLALGIYPDISLAQARQRRGAHPLPSHSGRHHHPRSHRLPPEAPRRVHPQRQPAGRGS